MSVGGMRRLPARLSSGGTLRLGRSGVLRLGRLGVAALPAFFASPIAPIM